MFAMFFQYDFFNKGLLESVKKEINNKEADKQNDNIQEKKTVFKLPIQYLKSELYPLNPIVSQDLELLGKPIIDKSVEKPFEEKEIEKQRETEKSISASRGIYEYLLQPQHQFALETIPLWNTHYTTDISFLEQSQSIIQSIPTYKSEMVRLTGRYHISCDNLLEIWSAIREDPLFLEKYSYIEFDYLKSFNENPVFLQSISLAIIAAPVVRFLLPIRLALVPLPFLK